MKRIILVSLMLVAACPHFVLAEDIARSGKSEVVLRQDIFTVPAGEVFRAVVTSSINTETAFEGQPVTLVLPSDWYYKNKMIASAGSSVNGSIISIAKAKHGSLNAKLTMRFTSIITPEGLNIPISASVKTEDASGVLMGGMKFETTPQYSKIVNVSDARVVTPLILNKNNSISPAVGSGGGLVKSIWDKGSEVDIPANSSIELILTQPITVKPSRL